MPALAACIILASPVLTGRARADTGPCDGPQGPAQYPDKFDWNGSYLFGDLYGVRSRGQQAGITLCSQYNAYVYDNANGGLKQGPLAQGQLFSWIDINLGKFTHIDGLNDTFLHAALYSMQGHPISLHEVGSFSAVSFTEQITTNRVGTAWIERRFFDGKVSIRGGQLGIDDEFMISPTATAFIDATFGFPTWLGTVLPGGGAAYPLQGPGLRAKFNPSEAVTLMAGAYTGNPADRSNPVPQLADRFGTTFNLNAGTLWIAEAAYSTAYPSSGVDLQGTYKLGAWLETAHRFDDLHFDDRGLSLANPSSTGLAKRYNNDFGVYGVFDQTLLPGDNDGVHKLASFLRVGTSPSNRNLIDLYADGGLTYTGLIPGRPADVTALGAAYDRISNAARTLDRDTQLFAVMAGNPTAAFAPVRDHEIVIEALYTINLTSWLAIDFDVQHFFHPSGHVLAVTGPNAGRVIKDSTLFGLNTQIKF
jgi:porin